MALPLSGFFTALISLHGCNAIKFGAIFFESFINIHEQQSWTAIHKIEMYEIVCFQGWYNLCLREVISSVYRIIKNYGA
jgi:hypothetical protein